MYVTVKSSPQVLPFQEILHYVQDDKLFVYCHSEALPKNLPEGWFTAEYKRKKYVFGVKV